MKPMNFAGIAGRVLVALLAVATAVRAEDKDIQTKAAASCTAEDIKKLVDTCAKGDGTTVTQLLDAGVDVNGRMSDGSSWTPLTRAADAGRVRIVKLLLKRGAKVDLFSSGRLQRLQIPVAEI